MQPPDCNAFTPEAIRKHGAIPVFLIRHGQTLWNKERRFLGRSDIPLDSEGQLQASQLAATMSSISLSHLYSSPLSRARQTAEALGAPHGIHPTLEADLTELDQGELEGMEGRLLAERYPEFHEAWRTDPTHVRIPGGETLAECQQRAVSALMRILDTHEPADTIALVSHKVAISGIICDAIGLPPRFNMMVAQANTAINLLAYQNGRISIVRLNDHDHLIG